MNPLSPFAYYRRHKRRALLLMSLITLPIPLAVIAASGGLAARLLRRLDPVSVIERVA